MALKENREKRGDKDMTDYQEKQAEQETLVFRE